MRSLVVLVDHRLPSAGRIRSAASIAQASHARLTLLAPIPRPSPIVWCAPVTPGETPRQLQEEIDRDCAQLLQAIQATVPADIGLTLRGRRGRPRKALREEIISGGHDVVVLDPPPRGPLAWVRRALDRRLTRDLEVSVLRPADECQGDSASLAAPDRSHTE